MSTIRTAGLLTVGTALVLSTASPSHAAAGAYVALGDSFSAGTGTKSKVDDCYRSQLGYPALLAQKSGLNLDYQACSGATTAGVRDNQLGTLNSSTAFVTMTIGGNDVGFADVLLECAKPGWLSDCEGAIAGGTAILNGSLPGRYDELFGTIKNKATNAKVTVGGYPHLFNGEDCNAATFFSPDEQSSLNSSTSSLGELIKSKAGAYGFGYVDPVSTFKGHAVCDNPEWINGLSNPVEESYHPNRAGNEAYASLFGGAVGKAYRAPSDRSASAEQASPAQQVQAQANYVLSLKLTSPSNLAKAQTAGVKPSEVKRLNSALRSSDTATVQQALDGLQALDRQM
ncbi:SGNH/GDSL hydrolase family protein [Demetria terragena]|uniref:SGNH/GDSL hydrolase family protein n=1 Tax=Demetria terragena TaxID=63959 RepID=UPI00036A2E30|nr:SGNH/GDSL hydrolase family protein [Demetria terragena]